MDKIIIHKCVCTNTGLLAFNHDIKVGDTLEFFLEKNKAYKLPIPAGKEEFKYFINLNNLKVNGKAQFTKIETDKFRNSFTPLSEWRDIQINEILND